MKSLSFEFNQAAANRQFSRLFFLLVAWYILTDDTDRRDKKKKRDKQRKKAVCKTPRRKGPSS